MERIENTLAECIENIRSGKASLNECLDRYPKLRPELEPLLRIALDIRPPAVPGLTDEDKQISKRIILDKITPSRQKKGVSLADILSLGVPPRLAWARVMVSIVSVMVVLSILAGGTAYASQSTVPGDFLYPVKIATEDARIVVAGSSAAKTELYMQFARTRLEELNKINPADEADSLSAVTGYQKALESALRQINSAGDEITPDLLEAIINKTGEQLSYIDGLSDAVTANPQATNQATVQAVNKQAEMIGILAQTDILKANEMYVDALMNRLQRARQKADTGDYQAMERVLLQYQEFNQLGQQILELAESTQTHETEIKNMDISTATNCLEILNGLTRQAPGEYAGSIDTSRQMTEQLEYQARYGRPDAGDHGPGPGGAPTENNDGTSSQPGDSTPQNPDGTGNPDNGSNSPTTTPGMGGDGGNGNGPGSPGDGSGNGGEGQGPEPTPNGP